MKFLGPDRMYRSLQEHLDYLEQCAKLWEVEGLAMLTGPARERRIKANQEQAARVRAKADELRRQFS